VDHPHSEFKSEMVDMREEQRVLGFYDPKEAREMAFRANIDRRDSFISADGIA